jgi:hypothetical protein
MNHPDKGKRFDLSEDTNKQAGLTDSSVFLYPTDGFGNPQLIKQLIDAEKIDAIMLITDPRYFDWLFRVENEIRKQVPILYLEIWDNSGGCYPLFNKGYYESCDLLMAISKLTYNTNKVILSHYEIPFKEI